MKDEPLREETMVFTREPSPGENDTVNEDENPHNIYDTETLDDFVNEDMISGAEEGFMLGYLDA